MKHLEMTQLLVLLLGLAGNGCLVASESESDAEQAASQQALESENGLNSVNGLSTRNGLRTVNGLNSVNGLSTRNGLRTVNGLNSVNGLKTINGLNSVNGLKTFNGLNSVNGLSSGNGLNAINGLGSGNGLNAINGLSSGNGLKTFNGINGFNGLSSGNGLKTINGINGFNGLSGNGLNAVNGLRTINGIRPRTGLNAAERIGGVIPAPSTVGPEGLWLANALNRESGVSVAVALSDDSGLASGTGLMASVGGRLVASYLVKCALPPGHSVTKYDETGELQTLQGAVGMAPEWETGACETSCQEWVTACMLAHVNLTGNHVGIWLTSSHPSVDWSTSPDYPNEEAAYFGNLFAPNPKAFVCYGENVRVNPIPGRVCVGDRQCPYADPYLTSGGYCETRSACQTHTEAGERQGYESCKVSGNSWSHIMTTWKK